jgi:hypothetical protein
MILTFRLAGSIRKSDSTRLRFGQPAHDEPTPDSTRVVPTLQRRGTYRTEYERCTFRKKAMGL